MNKAAFTYNLKRGMFGEIQDYPWIWATDVSGGWFYRKGSITRMSIPVLIGNAVDAISKNGAVMMNVAMRGDGTVPENQAAYLEAFGEWIALNGEGIYGTRPWKVYGEGPTEIISRRTGENLIPYVEEDIRFTRRDGKYTSSYWLRQAVTFILKPWLRMVFLKTGSETFPSWEA